jgi:hypothetical protein
MSSPQKPLVLHGKNTPLLEGGILLLEAPRAVLAQDERLAKNPGTAVEVPL